MAEKQYTIREVVDLANTIYNHCNRRECERFEPVGYCFGNDKNKLFKDASFGCYYAAELPWSDKQWCWFNCPANLVDKAKELRSLTWENLVENQRKR